MPLASGSPARSRSSERKPLSTAQTRSVLFSFWAGQLHGKLKFDIERALVKIEQRMPYAHRALIDAHVNAQRDIDWREEAEAVEAIKTLLNTPTRRQTPVERKPDLRRPTADA